MELGGFLVAHAKQVMVVGGVVAVHHVDALLRAGDEGHLLEVVVAFEVDDVRTQGGADHTKLFAVDLKAPHLVVKGARAVDRQPGGVPMA